MISQAAFEGYKAKANACRYTSMAYVEYEDCRNADVLCDTDGTIVLLDHTKAPSVLYFAADDFEQVICEIVKIKEPLRINFAPYDYKQKLMSIGFEIWAEFVDYLCPNLMEASITPFSLEDMEFLRRQDSGQVSLLSQKCAGQSRGFLGEEPEWFLEWMEDGNSVILARDSGRIAGFICVSVYAEGTTLWVREVAVDPLFQGRGYGKKLLMQAIAFGIAKGAVKGFLAADTMNQRAISIYKRYGFAQRGGEGELQMVRR